MRLEGRVDAATRDRALRMIWPEALGRLAFDDRTEAPLPQTQSLPSKNEQPHADR